MLASDDGGGLLGALGLRPQGDVATDIGPGEEGAGLAFLEIGQHRQVGLGALLVGAEEVTECGEFVPQGQGPQVARNDTSADPRLRRAAAPRGYGAGCGYGEGRRTSRPGGDLLVGELRPARAGARRRGGRAAGGPGCGRMGGGRGLGPRSGGGTL
ncbi:hypothetical protein GCM10010103_05160 [Streptomyces paradoxus]